MLTQEPSSAARRTPRRTLGNIINNNNNFGIASEAGLNSNYLLNQTPQTQGPPQEESSKSKYSMPSGAIKPPLYVPTKR